jgi:16S rRNA (adenine1518-N6/adenine1519-N6)-dimethyltransferase
MKWSKTRAFGQHYLADKRILREIVKTSQINSEEIVCEAGTGKGILTQELCKHAKKVISFEIDKPLYLEALNSFSHLPNLLLINTDIFKNSDLEFDVFVSNLPYSRSKDAILWLALKKFSRAIVMLQKEFVNKLQAKPGETNYRPISVISQYCFTIENLLDVSRTSFWPQPQIDSKLVRLTPNKHNDMAVQTLNNLNYIFSRRNKKASSVAKNLSSNWSSNCNWDNKRIYQLPPRDLVHFAESMIGSVIKGRNNKSKKISKGHDIRRPKRQNNGSIAI